MTPLTADETRFQRVESDCPRLDKVWHAIADFIMHIHIEENCPFIRTETSYLRDGNIFIYARSYLCIENTLIFMHRKHAHIYASKTRSYLCIEKHAHIYASKTRSYLDAVQCVRVNQVNSRCGRMTPVLIKSTERRLSFIRFTLLRYVQFVSHNC